MTSGSGASGGCHIFSGCGFPAPGLQDFNLKPLFTIGSFSFTKPMLLAILAALVVIGFFWAAFRKPKLVPRGMQNLGEMAILAVRDQILRPSLGRKGDSYLPFLVSLFFFIFVMNLMELIPVLQFPVDVAGSASCGRWCSSCTSFTCTWASSTRAPGATSRT